jgi:hypothetical protein
MRRAVLALGLASALWLVGCDDPTARPGDIVQGRLGEVVGEEYVVQVPTGRVRFVLGERRDEVAAGDAADGQEHAAPEGTEWQAVDWSFEAGGGLSELHRVLMDDPVARTTLVLASSGDEVALGDATPSSEMPADTRTSGPVHVAVPEGETPALVVEFAGRSTRVDLGTGEAAGDLAASMSEASEPTAQDCSDGGLSAGTPAPACLATAAWGPYRAGEGWSDDGWTLAQLETKLDSFEIDGTRYGTRSTTESSRLLDVGETSAETTYERGGALITHLLAPGRAAALRVDRTFAGNRQRGDGPEQAGTTYRVRVPLSLR